MKSTQDRPSPYSPDLSPAQFLFNPDEQSELACASQQLLGLPTFTSENTAALKNLHKDLVSDGVVGPVEAFVRPKIEDLGDLYRMLAAYERIDGRFSNINERIWNKFSLAHILRTQVSDGQEEDSSVGFRATARAMDLGGNLDDEPGLHFVGQSSQRQRELLDETARTYEKNHYLSRLGGLTLPDYLMLNTQRVFCGVETLDPQGTKTNFVQMPEVEVDNKSWVGQASAFKGQHWFSGVILRDVLPGHAPKDQGVRLVYSSGV